MPAAANAPGSAERPQSQRAHLSTARLHLDAPTSADLEELHALYRDPRVWGHFPDLRHTQEATTRSMLQSWQEAWQRDGLSQWIVREQPDGPLLGNCGVTLKPSAWWNLGYRFTPESQGYGFAREVAQLALEQARQVNPDAPVVAFLLEHNAASSRVAEAVGLKLRDRRPDSTHPDPDAVRMVYADRSLSAEQLDTILAHFS